MFRQRGIEGKSPEVNSKLSEAENKKKERKSILNFSQMHNKLTSSKVEELASLGLSGLTSLAEDFSSSMKVLGNRDGIRGGNIDGTSHAKFKDKEGDIWMAKDYPRERTHRALVDELVAGLSAKLGLETTMKAKTGQIDNKFKVFVGWEETQDSLWDDLQKTRWDTEALVKNLTEPEIHQIVSEQVLDWLVCNHDPHMGHFLRKKTGGFVCIDKAQAFKYIGSAGEQLSTTYNPNGSINGYDNINYQPIYNIVLPEIARGNSVVSLEKAWVVVEKKIRVVEQLSDEEYQQALLPYANFRFSVINSFEDQNQGLTVEKFMKLALDRKRNIRKDFENLYKKLKQEN